MIILAAYKIFSDKVGYEDGHKELMEFAVLAGLKPVYMYNEGKFDEHFRVFNFKWKASIYLGARTVAKRDLAILLKNKKKEQD